MEQDELTVREAITLSGLTRQGIYLMLANRRVKYRKVGPINMLDRKSFLEYLRTRRRGRRTKTAASEAPR